MDMSWMLNAYCINIDMYRYTEQFVPIMWVISAQILCEHGTPPWCPCPHNLLEVESSAMTRTIYPLVICYIAIEHGPFIVDLPIKDGDFP